MSEAWELSSTHDGTGRKIFMRDEAFTHTGNNEGTLTRGIKVEAADGAVLLETSMSVEWEYHGSVKADFLHGGTVARITGSDGKVRMHDLDGTD